MPPSCSRRASSSHDGTALALVTRGRAYTMPLWEEAVTEHPCDRRTSEPHARRRLLTWLHDDKRVAYVDDSGGFERIAVAPADQSAPPQYVTHADTGVLHQLVASPAGDRLAFANNRHELWLLDLGGEPRLLDRSVGERIDDLAFSPDGRWLAYVWSPKAHTTIVRIAECETRTHRRRDRRRCAKTARRRGIPKATISTSSRRATSTRSTTRCSSS